MLKDSAIHLSLNYVGKDTRLIGPFDSEESAEAHLKEILILTDGEGRLPPPQNLESAKVVVLHTTTTQECVAEWKFGKKYPQTKSD